MQIGAASSRTNRLTSSSFTFRARQTIWQGHIPAHGFMPAASPAALKAIGRTVRRWELHHRSDKSLQDPAAMYNPCIRGWINYYGRSIHAVASHPDEDRCLSGPLGTPQVQAASPSDYGRVGLVRSAPPRNTNALRSLAAMLWQRPNIGSRVNREVHARFGARGGEIPPRDSQFRTDRFRAGAFQCPLLLQERSFEAWVRNHVMGQ